MKYSDFKKVKEGSLSRKAFFKALTFTGIASLLGVKTEAKSSGYSLKFDVNKNVLIPTPEGYQRDCLCEYCQIIGTLNSPKNKFIGRVCSGLILTKDLHKKWDDECRKLEKLALARIKLFDEISMNTQFKYPSLITEISQKD